MTIFKMRMSDIRLTFDHNLKNKYVLSTPYGMYDICDVFIESFLQMVDVPHSALNPNNPFDGLFNAYAKRTSNIVKLYEREKVAVTILPEDRVIINHKSLEVIYSTLKKRYKLIDGFSLRGRTMLSILSESTFTAFDSDDNGGIFQLGLYIEVPHNGDRLIVLNRMLRQLMKGGIAIVADNKHAIKLDIANLPIKRIARELIDCIHYSMASENDDFISYVSDRLSGLRETKASLKELIVASNKITGFIDDPFAADELEIDSALDRYGLISPSERSTKWLATAKTTKSRLDIFNAASKAVIRCDKPKYYELAKYSGKIVTSGGDFEDLAPELD